MVFAVFYAPVPSAGWALPAIMNCTGRSGLPCMRRSLSGLWSRRFGLLQEEKDIPDSLLSDYRLDVAEPRTSLVFLMIVFFEISS